MPGALFWIGSSQFALKDYKGAIASHQALIAKYPDNPRVPDALLNLGYAQAESGDRRAARSTLESVIARYPQSQAAPLAKDRLARLPAR
jgi:tol-pal system protein YbgF